jgi:hypothetical protein
MSIDMSKVEAMHKLWKGKQDQVPESPNDWYLFRNEKGEEIRLRRADVFHQYDGSLKLISIVKITLGEAEKNAKDGE